MYKSYKRYIKYSNLHRILIELNVLQEKGK